jgi:hypothetical protein
MSKTTGLCRCIRVDGAGRGAVSQAGGTLPMSAVAGTETWADAMRNSVGLAKLPTSGWAAAPGGTRDSSFAGGELAENGEDRDAQQRIPIGDQARAVRCA